MNLIYSQGKFTENIDNLRKARNERSLRYENTDYTGTELIKWLESNVGEMSHHDPGQIISGKGWELTSNMWEHEVFDFPIISYVKFENDLSEEQQLEFHLRFS